MVQQSKKILVLRFGALGDIVHTTIIPRAIKSAHPDYEVHYCSEARYVHVLQNNPDIDKIIEFDHKRKKDFSYNLEIALQLRHEHYDVVFNLTNAFRNRFMTFIASPKKVYGKCPMGNRHVVEAFFEAAQKAFPELELPKNLRLGLDEKVNLEMKTRLAEYRRPFFVLSAGGETDINRQGRAWAPENWVELGKLLSETYGGTIFISGAPSEREYHKTIAQQIEGAVLFSGELPISHSMCLFANADLFISGDSGPLHIASGLGVKTIGLFGSTAPANVKPYGENGYSVETGEECKFCWEKKCKKLANSEKYTPCMNAIKPEKVMELVSSLLVSV